MYNFNHLFYFYLVVKLEGVTKAAKYLNTSQSSLSIQIKQLEENLKKKLLEKVGKKLILTSDGEVIYSYCKSAFENFEEMNIFLKNKTFSGRRKLRIGVVDEIERPFISSLFSRIIKNDLKNEVIINMHSAVHREIKEKFLVRDVDIAITSDPIIANGIKYSTSIELPVGLVTSSKLVYNNNIKDLNFKSFLKQINIGIALPSPNLKLRKEIDNFLSKNKISRNIVFESNVISTIVRSLTDGDTLSFLPLVYVEKELRQGRLVQLNKTDLWIHKLFIYSYSQELLDSIKKELLNSLNLNTKSSN
ncbi:MAG: LysR family transcriptional regulator [Bacteriovoracaceae bacterium]